jgi:hypothetical protein
VKRWFVWDSEAQEIGVIGYEADGTPIISVRGGWREVILTPVQNIIATVLSWGNSEMNINDKAGVRGIPDCMLNRPMPNSDLKSPFTYEKVKRLMEAAETILSNIYDAGEHAPSSGDTEDYADFPRDEDGDLVYPDVWELNQALAAVEAEDATE